MAKVSSTQWQEAHRQDLVFGLWELRLPSPRPINDACLTCIVFECACCDPGTGNPPCT